MMKPLRACFVAAITWSVFAPASLACSLVGHYVVPSNFELVDMADAIVVAKALSEAEGDSPFDSIVTFKVEAVLKGQPPETLDDRGSILGDPMPSDPHALDGANPEAYHGPCTRMTFAQGKSYVIFLANTENYGWRPMAYPFARVNEDYFGPDSLWVRTIRTYVEVERKFGPMEQLAELERMLEAKLKEPPSRYRDIEAADIVNHLRSRSPYKPTQYLVETYEQLERGEPLRFGLRPPSADAERSDAQALTDLLFGTKAPDKLTREQEMAFVLESLLQREHPDAAPLFERLIARPDVSANSLGAAIRFLAQNGQLRKAFDLIETRVVARLALESPENAQGLIGDAVTAMRGEDYDNRAWKSDAHVAARWPRLAFALREFQVRIVGPDRAFPFSDELETLKPANYRDWPEWTLARAGDHDMDVEAWAIAEVADKAKLSAYLEAQKAKSGPWPDDPAELPLQALARGFGEERDAALTLAFCQGRERRLLLIKTLASFGDSLDDEFFAQMLATPGLDREEREAITRSLSALLAREMAKDDWFGTGYWGGDEWYNLLLRATRGETSGANPIICPAN